MRWRGPCQAAPHRVGQLPGLPCTAGLPPVPATRQRLRFPGFFHVPEFPPSGARFRSVKYFLRLLRAARKRSGVIYFCSFLNPHDVHRIRAVIRTYLGLSTSLCTTRPQVTGRDLRATIIGIALCNRPVLIAAAGYRRVNAITKGRLRNLHPTAPYAQIASPAAPSSGSGPPPVPVNPMTISAQSRLNSDGIARLRGTGSGVSGWGLTPLRKAGASAIGIEPPDPYCEDRTGNPTGNRVRR
jgi:hypothetical protein